MLDTDDLKKYRQSVSNEGTDYLSGLLLDKNANNQDSVITVISDNWQPYLVSICVISNRKDNEQGPFRTAVQKFNKLKNIE